MSTIAIAAAPEEVPKLGDVVVAIDFGTSRTAYCWLVCGNNHNDVQAEIMSGVGSEGSGGVKTMTSVLLKRNTKAKGGYEVVGFGQDAEDVYVDADPSDELLLFKWFKMSLHKPFVEDPYVEAVGGGTSLPVSLLIQKSLEFVSKEAMRNLEVKDVLKSGNPHKAFWVLTVPAIWSDYGKGVMRSAAFKAGLIAHEQSSRLKLALEPECAAIDANRYNSSTSWKRGEKFMIADCGAGTLDIAAFKVRSAHPFELEQLIPPEGGPFGGKLVDNQFFEFLEDFLGMDNFDQMKQNGHVHVCVTKAWEEKKRLFVLDKDWFGLNLGELFMELSMKPADLVKMVDSWNRKHPDRPVKKQGRANIQLSGALMESFFVNVIEDILKTTADVLLKHKTELQPLNRLIVAGGFGNCPLLQKKFKAMFERKRGIDVFVGDQPDVMIVKGAAIFGGDFSRVIKSRKSRYTFGVDSYTDFVESNTDHRNVDEERIEVKNGKRKINIFDIHGKKGDDLQVDSRGPVLTYHPLYEGQSKIGFDILVTEREGSFFLHDAKGVVKVASTSVPVDMSLPLDERSVGVQFSFGDTEVICYLHDKKSGKELDRLKLNFRFVP